MVTARYFPFDNFLPVVILYITHSEYNTSNKIAFGEKMARQKQMGVTIPESARTQLEASSAAAGHSIAEEIRRRLERTFEEDARDPVLRDFVSDLVELAQLVKLDTGMAWHKDAASHAAFHSALLALLAQHKPEGPPVFTIARDLFGSGRSDDPETVGRALFRHLQRIKQVQATTLEKIRRLHQQKGEENS